MANDLTKQQRKEILPNVTAVRLLYPNDGKEIYNIESHETIRGRVFYRLTGLKGALFVRESLAPISPRQPNALDRAERERDEAARRERYLMWIHHGHIGIYGDDGEMQCGECSKFGCWDYKNAPIEAVRAAYQAAMLERSSAAHKGESKWRA